MQRISTQTHACGECVLRHKLSQNILRLFHVLPQFPFTASETELDYYYQKVNVRVDSRVAEQLKNHLRKLSAGID